MSSRDSGSIVVGVDVGGPKKGFHAVALQDGQYREKLSALIAEEVAEWCQRLKASVVSIDAPCRWSLTGRARACERALAAEKIFSYATPTQSKAENNKFYGWMLNGADLYLQLKPYYQLYNGEGPISIPTCFETFPHAVASALAGRNLSAKRKRIERRDLLVRERIAIESLKSIDEVDAALCAVTAHHFLAGSIKPYGDATEGYIVVPASRT